MKKRVFGILMSVLVLISSTNLFAATAWLQNNEVNTDGQVETEVIATATNGTAELISGNAITDADPLNVDSPVRFKFTADPGYVFANRGQAYIANDPESEGYYFSAEMRALWYNSGAVELVSANLDDYYDLVVDVVGTPTDTEIVLDVNVIRNEVEFPDEVIIAHLEPELSVDINVNFVYREVNELYSVTAVSNPVGVASFTGTGNAFELGNSYNVSYTLLDGSYRFIGWTGINSGTISGNVQLVANFERIPTPPPAVTYTVSAISNPVGVASFIGTGNSFVSGQNYAVYYNLLDSDYEFTGWTGVSEGIISGNVELVANFKLKEVPPVTPPPAEEEPILDEEVAEEILVIENIEEEKLPEAGGIPLMAFSLFGGALAGAGLKLRKTK